MNVSGKIHRIHNELNNQTGSKLIKSTRYSSYKFKNKFRAIMYNIKVCCLHDIHSTCIQAKANFSACFVTRLFATIRKIFSNSITQKQKVNKKHTSIQKPHYVR